MTLRLDNGFLETGDLDEAHAQLVQHLIQHRALLRREVPFGLLSEQRQDVDHLRRALEVDVRRPSRIRIGQIAEVDGGRTGERDHELREGQFRHREKGGPLSALVDYSNHSPAIFRAPTTMSDAAVQFDRLIAIMARLRAPDGCPWDREQTIDSLKRYVLEETYEVLEAIEQADHDGLREELGDFLLQAVFLAQLEKEAGHFEIADSVRAIADKLVRRHPHVFARDAGEPALETAAQVKTRWEEIKSAEQKGAEKPRRLLSGIPATLPSLLRAHQIAARAASVGFDWQRAADVIAKLREEIDEIEEVLATKQSAARLEEEVGDLLFAVANLSRKLGVEPEAALRQANNKFSARFTAMETAIEGRQQKLSELSLDELNAEWERVKRVENQ